jgi:hypothetical protein
MAQQRLTEREVKVLTELRANMEGMDGDWMQVYLDNCPSSRERGFNGVLGSLAKKGLYRPQGDDCFGDVLNPKCEVSEHLTHAN